MSRTHQVVFISDGAANAKRWQRIIAILAKQPDLLNYGFQLFQCELPRRNSFLLLQKPSLEFKASRLRRFLQSPQFRGTNPTEDPDLTLITAPSGRAIVQAALIGEAQTVQSSRAIHGIRHLIFTGAGRDRKHHLLLLLLLGFLAFLVVSQVSLDVSTVLGNLSSNRLVHKVLKAVIPWLLYILATIIAILGSDDLLRKLHIKATVKNLETDFDLAVRNANKTRYGSWPIPCSELPYGYIRPASAEYLQHLEFAILNPPSHPGIFDVTSFETSWSIQPASVRAVDEQTRHLVARNKQHIILGDNVCLHHKRVVFSSSNVGSDRSVLGAWVLRYASVDGIVVVNRAPDNNLWLQEHYSRYERDHKCFEYHFVPEPNSDHSVQFRIHGGFTGSQQRSHLHLRADTYYHLISETLDLSRWIEAGWSLKATPHVMFVQGPLPMLNTSQDHGPRKIMGLLCECSEIEEATLSRVPVEVFENGKGIYMWKLYGVRDGGYVEFSYSLTREDHA